MKFILHQKSADTVNLAALRKKEDIMADEKDFVFTTIKLRKEDKAALEQQAKEEGIPFGRHCGKVLESALKNRAAAPAA